MVSKTFSVLFYFKKAKTEVVGNQTIYMRITVDGERVELSTKMNWSHERWSARLGKALGTKEDAKSLNEYLETLRLKVYEVYRDLVYKEESVSAQKIKEKLTGVVERPKMIIEIFREHNEQIEQLVGNGYAPLTVKRHKTALRHTEEFIGIKYKKKDFEISKLNYEFISD